MGIAANDIHLKGIACSPGKVTGPIFIPKSTYQELTLVDAEAKMQSAIEAAAKKLEELAASSRSISKEGSDVLAAMALMVRDPALADDIFGNLRSGMEPANSVKQALEKYAMLLEQSNDEYMRERAADIRDLSKMILDELYGTSGNSLKALRSKSVIVASQLSPADILSADINLVLGIVTETGGRTSHLAIVAREVGIPAVLSVPEATRFASLKHFALVDGDAGTVTFTDALALNQKVTSSSIKIKKTFISIMANISTVKGAEAAAARGLQGVGLFRTEFIYLGRSAAPSEQEQYEVYERVCDVLSPYPVIIRTLDCGSDKMPTYIEKPQEEPNPALGLRGIRLWLKHKELYEPQILALLRTGKKHNNLKIMIPMVSALDEVITVKNLLEEYCQSIGTGLPSLGIMVEVPSAATALDVFQGAIDFISFGTNDLTQYTVAADRELKWQKHLSEFNPGLLRLLSQCTNAAKRLGISAGVCGEFAGVPEGAVFLAGIGVNSLSMDISAASDISVLLEALGKQRCREAAAESLKARTAEQAYETLHKYVEQAGHSD